MDPCHEYALLISLLVIFSNWFIWSDLPRPLFLIFFVSFIEIIIYQLDLLFTDGYCCMCTSHFWKRKWKIWKWITMLIKYGNRRENLDQMGFQMTCTTSLNDLVSKRWVWCNTNNHAIASLCYRPHNNFHFNSSIRWQGRRFCALWEWLAANCHTACSGKTSAGLHSWWSTSPG